MKKFVAFLIVLIILGAGGFFFGWAQFSVPPGRYGVMRSKIYGVDPDVIREGAFRWVWYKLIPTNVEITVYAVKPVSRSIRSSGRLPSGDVFATLAGIDADFSWEIAGDFSFAVKAVGLPALVERENLAGQEDLDALEERYAGRIEAFILDRIRVMAAGETEAMLVSTSVPGIDSAVIGAFPDIENFTCHIQTARYPDYALYQSVKGLYNGYIARQENTLRVDLAANAEGRIANRLRFDELAQYGELLTKYPVLLEYLTLEKGLPPAASD